MRVLHIIDSMFVGGAETLVADLATAAKCVGTWVEVYSLRGGGAIEDQVRKAGVPIHSGGPGSVYSPLHIVRLAKFIKSRHFDIIHVHLYPAQLWVCLAIKLSGSKTPMVTTEHSTSNRRRNGLFRWLDCWMYRRFEAVAAISQATRNALESHLGLGIKTISVVHNGVDACRFDECRQRPHKNETSALVVLSVGSLTRVKDQATAIKAIAQIEGVTLRLAGDGPLRAELETLASALGVRSRVEFLGIRRDIPQLIADSDIYVQPSRWEGFCLAVVEAMSGGLPCVISRNSGLEEVVGQAGLYFEPGDADELAAAVRALSLDPLRCAAMAVRSLDQASRFTLKACSAGYETLYREAIKTFHSAAVEDRVGKS